MDIGASFNRAWEGFFGFLPNLLGFLVIVGVGYVVARLAATAARKLLERAAIDQRLRDSDANRYVEMVASGARPSRGISRVVFVLIFAFFLFAGIGALGVPALSSFMNDVLAYLPNIIVAIVIFVAAAVLSSAVAKGVTRVLGETPTGKIVAAVVPALVMIIAMFMILEQLMIAEEIVRIAFAATMFALALGLALAFGLGGRDLAARMLEDAYRTGREHRAQARHDLEAAQAQREHEMSSVGYSSASFSNNSHAQDPSLSDDLDRTRSWSNDSPQSRF